MNRVDLHPEQLFDHLRDGSITPDEYELLQAHCGICTPCRLELRLVFEPMGAALPDFDDRALGMAVVDRMLHSPQRAARAWASSASADSAGMSHGVSHGMSAGMSQLGRSGASTAASGGVAAKASPSSPLHSAPDLADAAHPRIRARVSAFQRGRSAAFIAAGIVLGCSMTAAALVPEFSTGIVSIVSAVSSLVGLSSPAKQRMRGHAAVRPDAGSALGSSSAPVALAGEQPAVEQPTVEQSALAGTDVAPDSVGDMVADAPSADVERNDRASLSGNSRYAARARSGKPGIDGADTLLAAAARARARGAYAEAADYYRMLQRHYPNTEAEIVARVSLGRLLCLRLAQPHDALELFDDYLSQRPNGALGQEARSGRAQCLERLGRSDEARSAWQDLIEHHPNSVYADEARVRLARP